MTINDLRKTLAQVKAQGAEKLARANELEAREEELTDEDIKEYDTLVDEISALTEKVNTLQADLDRALVKQVASSTFRLDDISGGTPQGVAKPWADLGEFAQAVYKAQTAGGTIDERLMAAAPANTMMESGASGFAVPAEMRDELWELVFSDEGLIARTDNEPTVSNTVEYNADETTPWGSSGVQAYWRAEASQMSNTRLSETPRALQLHELYAMVTASGELIEDRPRLTARLMQKAPLAIRWKIDEAIVEGNGVGRPLGYLSSGALVTVAKESGQSANTVVAQNVIKMFSRMVPMSISRSIWLINTDTLPQLMTMTVGDTPIWMAPNGLASGPLGTLLGRPVFPSEYCATLGTVGDIHLVDLMGYYSVTKRSGMEFATSIHLYFDHNLQAFRWIFRVGGQPHLSAPITPNKGSSTRSHFVVLATRA